MKILVTGADGFIGRRLCIALEASGHTVVRYDVAQGDLTRADALDALPVPDFVYHLAARTFVPASWEEAHSFYHNNVMGSVTVLEYCRKHALPLLLMSTYVYGDPQYLPVDERHPLVAPSPYHESKLLCESLCAFYAERFGMSIRVFRPFNVYGAGQSEAFLLPKIMRQLLDEALPAIEVFDLTPKRDYVYIDDLVQALVCALRPLPGLQAFNIGTGVSVSVRDAIETAMAASGIRKPYRATQQTRLGEISDCRADIRKAEEVLGFTPEFSLLQGITKWISEIKNQP